MNDTDDLLAAIIAVVQYRAISIEDAWAVLVAARPAIEREVADERDDLAQRLSHLLCDLTNGRLSKTNYDVRTMVQEIEATFDKAWQTEWEASEWEVKAEAWDEGFDAGHQAARAVNAEWPEQPTNPYRIEREVQA